jgi:hypothetical protein
MKNSTTDPYKGKEFDGIIVLYRRMTPIGRGLTGGSHMEINNALQHNIGSIRQAIGIATLKKNLSQDAQSMSALLQGFQSTNARIMESSVSPHKGGSIDIRV